MSGQPRQYKITYDFKPAIPYLKRVDTFWFDNDGTLCLNNEENALDLIRDVCMRYLYKTHGIEQDPFNYHLYAGKPLRQICEDVGKRHGVPALPESVEYEILRLRQKTPFADEVIIVHPFMYGLVGACKMAGVHISVPTGGEADRAERYLRQAKLFPYFEDQHNRGAQWIFYGKKPDPTCMIQAMRANPHVMSNRKRAEPHRCVGLEDSLSGSKAVLAAGGWLLGHTLATHIPPERKEPLAQEMRAAGAAAVISSAADAMDCLIHVLKLIPKRPTSVIIDLATRRTEMAAAANNGKKPLPHDVYAMYQNGSCCILPSGQAHVNCLNVK